MEQNAAFQAIVNQWPDILAYIRNEFEISEISYGMWISPLKPHHLLQNSDGNIQLFVEIPEENDNLPNAGFQTFVSGRYAGIIEAAVEAVTGLSCRLAFYSAKEEQSAGNRTKPVSQQILSNAKLDPRYTFDTFVVGKNNNLAHAASLAVAENPGESYNPLFIYGGVGLGKTHLMQSIAHFVLQHNPSAKVQYVTSESFTNELIEAIRSKNNFTTTEFRDKYRYIDVLLIDDIQFIIGKDRTQEEFFHTFNALHGAKKQIIISSDKPPKELATLEDRLRSRFEWGLTVDIQPPDYETRMAILRKREELDHINVDNEVIQYIASNVRSNIRELEGSLTKIVAFGKLNHMEVNLELAQNVLRDIIDPNVKQEITPQFIIQVVAEHYGISELDLVGTKRTKELATARQVAMYLCREMTEVSLQQIGSHFGGKDHTTVLYAIKKISTEVEDNPDTSGTVTVLKKKISAQ